MYHKPLIKKKLEDGSIFFVSHYFYMHRLNSSIAFSVCENVCIKGNNYYLLLKSLLSNWSMSKIRECVVNMKRLPILKIPLQKLTNSELAVYQPELHHKSTNPYS